jgi:queuine tRNA-ribosyltransferase
MYKLIKQSDKSKARLGELKTAHGTIATPFFMTIATKGVVRSVDAVELKNDLHLPIILSNTYHLWLRPGLEVLQAAGGLHSFMNWHGPILTDSGGYQVFSLSHLRKLSEEGVKFQSHIDGRWLFLSPEEAIKIQQTIGSDMMMVLDECVPYPAEYDYAKQSTERSVRWAERCLEYKNNNDDYKSNAQQALFAIVQGGVYQDLRQTNARELAKLNFDGYAVGGLAVGEPRQEMYQILDWVIPELPENKARYLMGVGYPQEIVEGVRRGIDMFDCVIPTREARHGRLYLWQHDDLSVEDFYSTIHIKNEQFQQDFAPVDAQCDCYTCKNFTRAYLNHLFRVDDPLFLRLATIHNVSFYQKLMGKIRAAIEIGSL